MKKSNAKKTTRRKGSSRSRLRVRRGGFLSLIFIFLWAWLGVWFVHHPREWLATTCDKWPAFITAPLFWIGNPVGDFTDSMGLTGSDVVYEFDEPAPNGRVTFAGDPKRVGLPAPADIQIIDRGEFRIGWSPSLRHPIWVAYHVPANATQEAGPRPKFTKDSSAFYSPSANEYKNSGYDRGHMAPNYAIATRFGDAMQKKTFLMSNITPQRPTLNRGVWKEIEHRIADLWTARWGEIWVIVGCVPSKSGTKFSDGIDVPDQFFQLVVAQDGFDVRAFAVLFDQEVPWGVWPTRSIVSIDELEEITGLDFLADLPDFIQRPLEAERPTRLWPICKSDIIRQILFRLTSHE